MRDSLVSKLGIIHRYENHYKLYVQEKVFNYLFEISVLDLICLGFLIQIYPSLYPQVFPPSVNELNDITIRPDGPWCKSRNHLLSPFPLFFFANP